MEFRLHTSPLSSSFERSEELRYQVPGSLLNDAARVEGIADLAVE